MLTGGNISISCHILYGVNYMIWSTTRTSARHGAFSCGLLKRYTGHTPKMSVQTCLHSTNHTHTREHCLSRSLCVVVTLDGKCQHRAVVYQTNYDSTGLVLGIKCVVRVLCKGKYNLISYEKVIKYFIG